MRENILKDIKEAVISLNFEGIKSITENALKEGITAYDILMLGFYEGLREVGRRYEAGEYFLSELVAAGEIMKRGNDILRPHLGSTLPNAVQGTMVIGTVSGDIHDIGKNIFTILAESSGFSMYDLGVDVAKEKFSEKIRETQANILGMSALLTSTMVYMKEVISLLKSEGLRDRVKVIVGGAPMSPSFAEKIEADAGVNDAIQGLRLCKKWVKPQIWLGF